MKTLTLVMTALACASAYAVEELPREIKDLPKEQIVDVTPRIYAYKPAGGIEKDDPESPTGKAAVLIRKNLSKPEKLSMGVYDPKLHQETKKVVAYTACRIPDEKYHWYKIKWYRGATDGVIGEKSQIYLCNWGIGVKLDGITGKYDYWVCVKGQGPLYVDGSTKENAVYLCRAVLVKR